ncbi:FAD dependent oxidoreductase [Penicillium sp. CMV-2018d]|nr:FAD dependent oxidoreductase [Penicillium sp. CMV-2018d]
MPGYATPIDRVAVIGAGISGVVSAAHLLAAGLQVTAFERNEKSGGIWLHDKRVPIEGPYPCVTPADLQNYGNNIQDGNYERHVLHAPPGPCYDSLRNNIATPLLRTTLNDWPENTPDYVNHHVLLEYIQETSKRTGVDKVTEYGALVTKIYKQGQKWQLNWTSLLEDPKTGDFVETYHSSNVLLVGGGVSSTDIARDIGPVAGVIYQSTRDGSLVMPASVLPDNASRVSEIVAFEIHATKESFPGHLPLTAHLKSNETLHDIDIIVFCTGYQMTLPFFPQYNNNTVPVTGADDSVLVTDGSQIHNLHRDIFYIPDPTLAFVGIPLLNTTFTLFEFQAMAVAAFLSGTVQLPSTSALRKEYNDRVRTKGYKRNFHSLKDDEETYVSRLVEWINSGREERGLPLIEGHTRSWLEGKQLIYKEILRLRALKAADHSAETKEVQLKHT